jgi:hypothetical protein
MVDRLGDPEPGLWDRDAVDDLIAKRRDDREGRP